jgi:4-hydroxy-4-methyl-2-oxoglutarate aldolase
MKRLPSLLLAALLAAPTLFAQAAAPAQDLKFSRDTYSPLMEVLRPARTRVSDDQLARLKAVPIEAVWGAIQKHKYQFCFVNGMQMTQPSTKLVGRALTMRYLPVRPDLVEGVTALAKGGDWDTGYNMRASDDIKPGDVLVVELAGAVDRATFMGDVTGLAIKTAGAAGVVIDGGLRDLSEFLPMKDFPVYYR